MGFCYHLCMKAMETVPIILIDHIWRQGSVDMVLDTEYYRGNKIMGNLVY